MAIPLVGSPVPPVNVQDILTGNDRTFSATLGNWVVSGAGATVTRDTTTKMLGATASAKFVGDSGDYVEVPVPGTFKAGVEYMAVVYLRHTPWVIDNGVTVHFGVPGTEDAQSPASSPNALSPATVGWVAYGAHWTPTVNYTGVKLRVARTTAVNLDWYVGEARVFRVVPGSGAVIYDAHDNQVYAPVLNSWSVLSPWSGGGSGLQFNQSGALELGEPSDQYGFGWDVPGGATPSLFDWAVHAAADLADKGRNIEVGTDLVGLTMSERDSGTMQFYADIAGGYIMQLRHRGSGKGWAVSDDGTVNARVEAYFEWHVTIPGTLTTGTNKGGNTDYIQAPFKCRVDEVRVHVGTAPTGATILIDVNDDGVTVFTSQANRPTIAISGTDATSGAADGGTAIAKNSVITVDIDQVGSGVAGADATVLIRGRAIW